MLLITGYFGLDDKNWSEVSRKSQTVHIHHYKSDRQSVTSYIDLVPQYLLEQLKSHLDGLVFEFSETMFINGNTSLPNTTWRIATAFNSHNSY